MLASPFGASSSGHNPASRGRKEAGDAGRCQPAPAGRNHGRLGWLALPGGAGTGHTQQQLAGFLAAIFPRNFSAVHPFPPQLPAQGAQDPSLPIDRCARPLSIDFFCTHRARHQPQCLVCSAASAQGLRGCVTPSRAALMQWESVGAAGSDLHSQGAGGERSLSAQPQEPAKC